MRVQCGCERNTDKLPNQIIPSELLREYDNSNESSPELTAHCAFWRALSTAWESNIISPFSDCLPLHPAYSQLYTSPYGQRYKRYDT